VHTGIGPFNVSKGSTLGYATARYVKNARRVSFFTNLLSGDASNLLAPGLDGKPLPLAFDTKTFDVEANDTRVVAMRHALSYGGNFRHNTFDISIAPNGGNRNEGGGYLQDEIFLNNHLRWVIGGRVDKFSSIHDAVFSPRTTLVLKPDEAHSFRVSFNRAFRAPSYVNNYINTAIVNQVSLAPINPALGLFAFPIRAVGNPDLKQETMTSVEVGYTGVVRKRATVTVAVYRNQTRNGIYFNPIANFTSAAPPPRWPLPPQVLDLLAASGRAIPSRYSYVNIGRIVDKGIELGVDGAVNQSVNAFANYSYQWTPLTAGAFTLADINLPAHHRANAGFDFSRSRYLGNLSVSYTGQAYWQDVLDVRYAGTTKPYTLVNGGFGVRWAHDVVTTSVKVTNLANQEVMAHVFGDVLKRSVIGELRVAF
jgi:outer membrane receptor protein involved in Fe transport